MLFRYALHCHVLPMQGALHHALRGETEVTVDSSLQDPPIEYTCCLYINMYIKESQRSVWCICAHCTHTSGFASVLCSRQSSYAVIAEIKQESKYSRRRKQVSRTQREHVFTEPEKLRAEFCEAKKWPLRLWPIKMKLDGQWCHIKTLLICSFPLQILSQLTERSFKLSDAHE